MDNEKKSLKFGLGVLVGGILGGLLAFFFSPQSGKKNRQMIAKKLTDLMKKIDSSDVSARVREIYGEASEAAVKTYTNIKKQVLIRLRHLKEKAEQIDRQKYKKLVDDVVDEVKKDALNTSEKLAKIKQAFMQDWHHIFSQDEKKETQQG